MGIAFWCAGCGQPLAADDVDAGREVECVRCRAVVRVPRNPAVPGVDDNRPDASPQPGPTFAAEDARAARTGIRLVGVSFVLFLMGAVTVGIIAAYDFVSSTPAPLQLRTAAGLFWAATLLAGGILRIVGYFRCRPVGHVLEVEWALTCGIVGAVLLTAGLVAVVAINVATAAAPDPTLERLGCVSLAAAPIAAVVELIVLVFYRQVLAEHLGHEKPRWVRNYLLTLALTAGGVLIAPMMYGFLMMGVGGLRVALIGNPAWLPVAPELVVCVVAGVVFATVMPVVMARQYLGLLSQTRAGLAAATRPAQEPVP